jgi:hyperosmotically inducible periplasmic protein
MTRSHWKSLTVLLTVLTLLAVGCRSTTGQSVGQNIDDKTLLASVKSKLVADKASNLTRVNVDVTNGTVYLTGNVESAEQKSRAEQIAHDVKGVRSVVNNLQIQKQ